jgi:sphingolipid C9-methyltransferase
MHSLFFHVHSRTTSYAAIANAPLPAEGSSSFSNVHLGISILLFPAFLQWSMPWIFKLSRSWTWYWILVAVFGLPVSIAYWALMSRIGGRVNEKCILPGKGLQGYVEIKDAELRKKYPASGKMPMQVFHDAYFEGKIEFKGELDSKVCCEVEMGEG